MEDRNFLKLSTGRVINLDNLQIANIPGDETTITIGGYQSFISRKEYHEIVSFLAENSNLYSSIKGA